MFSLVSLWTVAAATVVEGGLDGRPRGDVAMGGVLHNESNLVKNVALLNQGGRENDLLINSVAKIYVPFLR